MSRSILPSAVSDSAAASADKGANDAPGLLYTSEPLPLLKHSIIPSVRRSKCLDLHLSATVIDEEKNQ